MHSFIFYFVLLIYGWMDIFNAKVYIYVFFQSN